MAVIAARLAPAGGDAPVPIEVAEVPADAPEPEPAHVPVHEPESRDRLTVYRAHYRLVLKGPERGTWAMGLIEEADAPPPTVGAVVRGVHERAGGDDEPERLSGDAFRVAISDRPWAPAG